MSTMVPYGYQKSCLRILRKRRENNQSKALVIMAMGLGKTAVAAFDVLQFVDGDKCKVLYLCHQNDILEQAQPTFSNILGENWSMGYLHGNRKDFDVDVLFASFQTMPNWLDRFGPDYFDYIIVDESHHVHAETYLPTVKYFKPEFLLGITATPDREDLLDIREIFGKEVFNLSLERALARGYLTPVDYRVMTDNISDISILEQMPAGRLSIAELDRKLFLPRRDEEIVRLIQEKMVEIKNPKVSVFCRNIEHAERISGLLPGAEFFHSKQNPKVQKSVLKDFRRKKHGIIVTVNKFNEGIDVREMNMMVFLRATQSRRIFFQQLGRGLRKAEGKDKVVVLDFVGNINRLIVVKKLITEVELEREKVKSRLTNQRSPLTINTGSFEFDEKAIDILNLIEKIELKDVQRYSDQDLLDMLSQYFSKFGEIPTARVIGLQNKLGNFPTVQTFKYHFGTVESALRKIGIQIDDAIWRSWNKTNDNLLDELRDLIEELGRFPSRLDITKANHLGKCGSVGLYTKRFGSMSNAVKQLGYFQDDVFAKDIDKYNNKYTDHELLELLRIYHREYGILPGREDLVKLKGRYRVPYSGIYADRFGSFSKALQQAGFLEVTMRNKRRNVSNEQIIEELRALSVELGRAPKQREVDRAHKEGKCASATTYADRFGSFRNALSMIDQKLSRRATYDMTDADLLEALKRISSILGKIPSQSDVDEYSKLTGTPSVKAYRGRFGSFRNALNKAGLIKEENE